MFRLLVFISLILAAVANNTKTCYHVKLDNLCAAIAEYDSEYAEWIKVREPIAKEAQTLAVAAWVLENDGYLSHPPRKTVALNGLYTKALVEKLIDMSNDGGSPAGLIFSDPSTGDTMDYRRCPGLASCHFTYTRVASFTISNKVTPSTMATRCFDVFEFHWTDEEMRWYWHKDKRFQQYEDGFLQTIQLTEETPPRCDS